MWNGVAWETKKWGGDCLYVSHPITQTTKPITIKFCTKMAHIAGIDIGLYSFQYISPFKDGVPFSDVPTLHVKLLHFIVLALL